MVPPEDFIRSSSTRIAEAAYADDIFEAPEADDQAIEEEIAAVDDGGALVGSGVVPDDVVGYDVPEEDEWQAEGSEEDDKPSLPPTSVYWKVDDESGASHAQATTVSGQIAAVDVVPDDAPTEYMAHTRDVSSRAHELCEAGEQLIGEAKFAEIVEVLTRDQPVSSEEVQQFIRSRVADERLVPDLLYLCFRYILLAGELRQRRGAHQTVIGDTLQK